MTTGRGVLRPFGHQGPQGHSDARSPMTTDRLAIAADQIQVKHNRSATGFEASAPALPKAPGRGWSAWLANVKRRRRLAREERLESIERLQRLERRKRQSGEYVPDRRNPPYWL